MGKDILVSCEEFGNLTFSGNINFFLRLIKKNKFKLIIVLLVRNPQSIFSSYISEAIRAGYIFYEQEKLYDLVIDKGFLETKKQKLWFDYKLQIAEIKRKFKIKKNQIIIKEYTEKNVVNNFCNIFGINYKKIDNIYDFEAHNKRKNHFRVLSRNQQNMIKMNINNFKKEKSVKNLFTLLESNKNILLKFFFILLSKIINKPFNINSKKNLKLRKIFRLKFLRFKKENKFYR